jgi:hypothetical protein
VIWPISRLRDRIVSTIRAFASAECFQSSRFTIAQASGEPSGFLHLIPTFLRVKQ